MLLYSPWLGVWEEEVPQLLQIVCRGFLLDLLGREVEEFLPHLPALRQGMELPPPPLSIFPLQGDWGEVEFLPLRRLLRRSRRRGEVAIPSQVEGYGFDIELCCCSLLPRGSRWISEGRDS